MKQIIVEGHKIPIKYLTNDEIKKVSSPYTDDFYLGLYDVVNNVIYKYRLTFRKNERNNST